MELHLLSFNAIRVKTISKACLALSAFSLHSTSLKYSKPSATDGSRLLLVCDVALGCCKDVCERDPTLTRAPEGHHSVHGVRRTPSTPSEFEVGLFGPNMGIKCKSTGWVHIVITIYGSMSVMASAGGIVYLGRPSFPISQHSLGQRSRSKLWPQMRPMLVN